MPRSLFMPGGLFLRVRYRGFPIVLPNVGKQPHGFLFWGNPVPKRWTSVGGLE